MPIIAYGNGDDERLEVEPIAGGLRLRIFCKHDRESGEVFLEPGPFRELMEALQEIDSPGGELKRP